MPACFNQKQFILPFSPVMYVVAVTKTVISKRWTSLYEKDYGLLLSAITSILHVVFTKRQLLA